MIYSHISVQTSDLSKGCQSAQTGRSASQASAYETRSLLAHGTHQLGAERNMDWSVVILLFFIITYNYVT